MQKRHLHSNVIAALFTIAKSGSYPRTDYWMKKLVYRQWNTIQPLEETKSCNLLFTWMNLEYHAKGNESVGERKILFVGYKEAQQGNS